jgi:ribosomal protein S18 acetylase RimI-like enzyme
MIRPFSLSDLESLLQIENQSFPKSPYDWTTFLSLHTLYPETFLVYISPSTPPLEASSPVAAQDFVELRVDSMQRLLPRSEGRGLGAAERVHTDPEQRKEKISAYIVFSRDGHILSIAVHPHHRRRGVATKLLFRAMETSWPKKVWAEVRRSNQGAQAFYDTIGFKFRRTVRSYYGNEDALIMEWTPPDSPPPFLSKHESE